MPRSIPWVWILLAVVLLLAPGPAGRFLIELLGSITLLLLLLPLLLGAAGFVGWQLLRRRLRTCAVCGFSSLDQAVCPACGTPYDAPTPGASGAAASSSAEVAAADATIDVDALPVEDQAG